MLKEKKNNRGSAFPRWAAFGALLVSITGCVVEPYPPYPPPPALAAGPAQAPGYYYGGPYSYYDYPPYPGYVYGGPTVGFVFDGRDGYHRHWR